MLRLVETTKLMQNLVIFPLSLPSHHPVLNCLLFQKYLTKVLPFLLLVVDGPEQSGWWLGQSMLPAVPELFPSLT